MAQFPAIASWDTKGSAPAPAPPPLSSCSTGFLQACEAQILVRTPTALPAGFHTASGGSLLLPETILAANGAAQSSAPDSGSQSAQRDSSAHAHFPAKDSSTTLPS